ncbi:hypothetical protein SteCoe_1699 [Stentor coeruleus]|uniref:SAM domain-containing protein n=1 Tax=Stentor coeruleus TaxID=5963 RepID=A0A1R2D165_9CILI|nr:hypothetical protein SteCoe_1699 [Stentor coeruleus]
MSLPKSIPKPKTRPIPRSTSPFSGDSKILLLKERMNQVFSNMKSPLKLSNSITSEQCSKETRIKISTPTKNPESETLESFLSSNGFENYINCFQENLITLEDLPFLTKEDLNSMKLPIGPRNRLMKIIKSLDMKNDPKNQNDISKREMLNQCEEIPSGPRIKDEVDKFMNDLSQFSKRSEQKIKPLSREQSMESFDSDINNQKLLDNVLGILKEISDKQNIMMKAIEENQKAIGILKRQIGVRKNKNMYSEY